MMPADIPPAIHEKVVCSIGAAAKYGVPANIILAVAQREGGRPGQWVRNNNATYDIGSMQFNTAYIRTLAPVEGRAAAHDLPFPFNIRRVVGGWKLLFFEGASF